MIALTTGKHSETQLHPRATVIPGYQIKMVYFTY